MRRFGPHSRATDLFGAVRQLVFGVEDGIVSTTGAVLGIAAGSMNSKIVLLSGIVIVVVEALSMAAGEYLSSKSHREMLARKIREEKEEIERKPGKERAELEEMYRKRGFSAEETEILVRRITSDKRLWLEEMMAKELRIGAGELDDTRSGAFVMWISYTLGGSVPVIPFVFLSVPQAIAVSFMAALIALFTLGFWKARVSGTSPWKGAVEMIVIAAGAGVIGYVVGLWLGTAFGIHS